MKLKRWFRTAREVFTRSKAWERRQSGGAAGDYYKLCAVFSNSSEIIYTPVDAVSSLRPLISGGEAANYLELFARLEPHVFRSSKPTGPTAHYQGMLASRKVEDCLLLIKEIYVRQGEMARQEKQLGPMDARYLKLAETLICEGFSVVLDTTPDSIRKRLYTGAECKAAA